MDRCVNSLKVYNLRYVILRKKASNGPLGEIFCFGQASLGTIFQPHWAKAKRKATYSMIDLIRGTLKMDRAVPKLRNLEVREGLWRGLYGKDLKATLGSESSSQPTTSNTMETFFLPKGKEFYQKPEVLRMAFSSRASR